MAKLTDAQTSTLLRGAQHVGGFISPAAKTPMHMALAQAKKLDALGLVQEAPCFHDEPFYSRDEDTGDCVGYRLTAAGFDALGIDPSEWPAYCTQDPDADPEPAGSMHADDGLVVVEAAEPFGEHPLPAALEQTLAAADGSTSLGHLAAAAHDAGFEVTMELVKPAQGGDTGALGGDAAQDDAQGQDGAEAAQGAPGAAPRANVRDAAAEVLEEWDDRDNNQYGLPEAIERLRAALAAKPGRPTRLPGAPRKPREGTKQQTVLAMLRREEGATVTQIAEATEWAGHTVRGFLTGLKKKGFQVIILERVRMVGPNKEGAKGSYTIYRIAA